MKSSNASTNIVHGVRVIVRGWRSEPQDMLLYVVENNGKTAIVGREKRGHTIGVPITDVYPFDVHIWDTLRELHASGGVKELDDFYEAIPNKNVELMASVEID